MRTLLIMTAALFSTAYLAAEPQIVIESSKKLDYERPARLEEEDSLNGTVFEFTKGLEIVSDIEYVKVYIFDLDSGRTPYENNTLANGYTRIRLEKPGYEDVTFWVNIKTDYRTTVTVRYKSSSAAATAVSQPEVTVQKTAQIYKAINPGDPIYYRQLVTLSAEDSSEHISADIKDGSYNYITSLLPESSRDPFVFTWDGENKLEEKQETGIYKLQMVPKSEYEIELTKAYSRKPASYWSGSAGFLLSPTAQLLFPGGFQFGSTFTFEKIWNTTTNGLPFSFFIRFSPLKRWEAAFESEIAFINESKTPSLRLNSSQKVQIVSNEVFQLALGIKGSYTASINDLKDPLQTTLIRDPGGISFFVPIQFDLNNWDFVAAPELMYTFDALPATGSNGTYDLLSVVRWGVGYSEDYLGASLSAALFIPMSPKENVVTQVGVEGYLYIPNSPMYIGAFFLAQSVENQDEDENLGGYGAGVNLGFLF